MDEKSSGQPCAWPHEGFAKKSAQEPHASNASSQSTCAYSNDGSSWQLKVASASPCVAVDDSPTLSMQGHTYMHHDTAQVLRPPSNSTQLAVGANCSQKATAAVQLSCTPM